MTDMDGLATYTVFLQQLLISEMIRLQFSTSTDVLHCGHHRSQ